MITLAEIDQAMGDRHWFNVMLDPNDWMALAQNIGIAAVRENNDGRIYLLVPFRGRPTRIYNTAGIATIPGEILHLTDRG